MAREEDATNEYSTELDEREITTQLREDLAPPLRSQEPFAIGSDGRFFINVNVLDPMRARDLAGRPLFVGAELTHDESRLALEVLQHAAHDLRARIAGALWKPNAPPTTSAPARERDASIDVGDEATDDGK